MNTDGGPAFPMQALASPGSEIAWGMSLRDWFAGQALAGLMAGYQSGPMGIYACAQVAIETADAMLRARERGQEADDDEAWFRAQVNACVYSLPDGSHEASIDYGSLSWTACGANRAAAIRALRVKVEGEQGGENVPNEELPDEHWHKIQTRPSLSWHPARGWEAACELRGTMMYGRGKTIAQAQAALRAEWEGGAQ